MKAEKRHRSVRLKDKDLLLFDFIAKFGFANVNQLHRYLGGSINSLKTRLSHLVNDGYLVNHRIFFNQLSVYTVTVKSNRTELGLVRNISLKSYEHDILVIDVFLALRGRFTHYASEKMIRALRGVGVGKSGRLPDLVGYTGDGKAIAIELDRTDKSLERLKGIVVSYATQHEYYEVWFICCNQLIFNNLEKVGFDDKIKLYHLKDVLNGKELSYINKTSKVEDNRRIEELKQKSVTPLAKAEEGLEEHIVAEPQVTVIDEDPQHISEKKEGKFFGNFRF